MYKVCKNVINIRALKIFMFKCITGPNKLLPNGWQRSSSSHIMPILLQNATSTEHYFLCMQLNLESRTFLLSHYIPNLIFRLAVGDDKTFGEIGIRNAIHRRKIILKATDLVLFGTAKSILLFCYHCLFAI